MAFRSRVPRPGESVASRFEIADEIGRGGFSVVYEAMQLNLGRRVAIKMLLPEILGDSYNVELFRREARFAKNLRHPYIIEIYDYGETRDGLPYIVMELLKGEALADTIGITGMDQRRLWQITVQTLKALMAAHRQGVVHRDIKPSNIFICEFSGMEDFVKVIDFGIAKAFAGSGEKSLEHDKVVGTPNYMAPEQIMCDGLGPHSDLYALGLVMAEAITGQLVYHEEMPLMEILQAQISDAPPPFSDEVKRSRLWPIISKATEKDPEVRYRTAAQMLEDIERLDFGSGRSPSVNFKSYAPAPIAAPLQLPSSGTVLGGRFRLESLISRRRYTAVYQGTQLSLERPVAIKMLLPEALEHPEIVKGFEDEALIVRQLRNPYTIRIVDFGQPVQGLPFMAFEWLNGYPLNAILSNVRLLPSQVRDIGRQILASLREAHSKGILHRDIRPTSIFICDVGLEKDQAKLTDFGQSASFASGSRLVQLSGSDEVLGTPHHMAPEQLLRGRIGPHTDIYSLGLVMAEALSGQPVYDPDLAPSEVAQMQASSVPPPIPEWVLSGPLGTIIEKATRKEVGLRYTSVDEMIAALDRLDLKEKHVRTPTWKGGFRAPIAAGFEAVREPHLKWKCKTGAFVRSSPVIGADGTLYFGSFDGLLYAVYPNGNVRWVFESQGEIRASPVLDVLGNIYFGSRDARVYALTPMGQKLWAYETVGPVYSSPVIDRDGVIHVGSGDRFIYALRPDGVPEWYTATRGPISSTPALSAEGTIYVGSEDQQLYAISSEGQIEWSYKTGGRINGSPATDKRGTIYVGSEDEHLHALTHEGQLKWRVQMAYFMTSTPVIAPEGTIYVATHDGTLHAISPEGHIKWSFKNGEAFTAAPNLDAAGNIYIGSNDDHLYSISSEGRLNWTFELGDWIQSTPVVGADGTVYVGADDHCLYAITDASRI